jgi:eukaryotic-like serine/threonine-protein kinase
VKITPNGTAKVLDFGLAKALEDDYSVADISTSPTLSHAATQAGILLGTAAYMSPEQARGKPDRRFPWLAAWQGWRSRTLPWIG